MSLTTTITDLQGLAAAVVGIKKAPTTYPGSLNTADMPICICWPDATETINIPWGSITNQNDFRLAVYVDPIEQGMGRSEVYEMALTLLQRFIDKFSDPDNALLSTTTGGSIRADLDTPITTSGIRPLAYPPTATGIVSMTHYWAFELIVRVKEQYAQT